MHSSFQGANTAFAIDLLREAFAQSSDQAVQVSPFSVRRACTMAAIGSRGGTRSAFLDTFRLPSDVDLNEVNADNHSFLQGLMSAESRSPVPTVLKVANALWLKKDEGAGYRFLETFKAANKRYYDAPAVELDFVASDVDVINGWCAESTEGKIPTIIDNIPEDARYFLTDAFYMKSPANKAFLKENDESGEFVTVNGVTRPVTFMVHPNEEFGYFNTGSAEVLRFPLGAKPAFMSAFNLYLLLPSRQSSLQSLVSSLSGAAWTEMKSRIEDTYGRLRMPPNEQGYDQDLKDVLAAMGLDIAFSDVFADFLDMCTGRTKIGAVMHKTYTKLLRKGFEGAAVTCVSGIECLCIGSGGDPFDITVDRPYAWLVEGNGEILFAATTTDPKEPADFATEEDD